MRCVRQFPQVCYQVIISSVCWSSQMCLLIKFFSEQCTGAESDSSLDHYSMNEAAAMMATPATFSTIRVTVFTVLCLPQMS